jgi:hypothetical protein
MVLPYPQGTDPNNYPGQMQSLAQAIDPIASIFLQGTFASRPAAAKAGRVYCATDTLNVYWDTGTAWIQLNLNAASGITAKGDLLVGSGAGALSRIGVGTDGQALVSLAAATNGVQWQSMLGLPLALTGAASATRWVGGTTAGPPSSGTFVTGDFVIAQNGRVWICTAGGSPGTWQQVGANNPTFRREATTAQAITNSSTTYTVITFNIAASEDQDNGFAASSTTYTVATPGVWVLGYSAPLVTPNNLVTGSSGLLSMITKNGTGIPGTGDQSSSLAGTTQLYVGRTCEARLAAGDTLDLRLLQNTGANRNTSPSVGFGDGVVFWGHFQRS